MNTEYLDPTTSQRHRVEEFRIETMLNDDDCVTELGILDKLLAALISFVNWLVLCLFGGVDRRPDDFNDRASERAGIAERDAAAPITPAVRNTHLSWGESAAPGPYHA